MSVLLDIRDERFATVFGAGRGRGEPDSVLSAERHPSERAKEDLRRWRRDAAASDGGLGKALTLIGAHPQPEPRRGLLENLRTSVHGILGRRVMAQLREPLGAWFAACGALPPGASTVVLSPNGKLHLWQDGRYNVSLEFAAARSKFAPTLACGKDVGDVKRWRHAEHGAWQALSACSERFCSKCVYHEHERAFEDDCFTTPGSPLPPWCADGHATALGRALAVHAADGLDAVDAHGEAALYDRLLAMSMELIEENREKAVQQALGVERYFELRARHDGVTLYTLLKDADWDEHLRAYLPARASDPVDAVAMCEALRSRLIPRLHAPAP